MIKRLVSHPLFSGSAVMVGGSMFINGISYLYHVIMGRILGPAEYGVLSSIFSFFYVFAIVPLSTSVSIVKFVSAAKTKREAVLTYFGIRDFMFKLAIAALVLVLLLAIPFSRFLHLESAVGAALVAPTIFFSLMALVNQASMQGLLNFWGVVGPNLVSNSGKLVLGIVLVWLGYAVPGAMVGVLLGAVGAYLYSAYLIKRQVSGEMKGKFDLRNFLGFSLPALLQALAFTSIFTIDVVLARHFLPATEAGIYASLSTLGKIVYFAATPIAGVMFPIVSRRHARGEAYMRVFGLAFFSTALMTLAIVAVYRFLPNLAIGVLFGKEYLGGSGNLALMGLFMGFYVLSYLLVNYFLSVGETKAVVLPILAGLAQALLIFFVWHGSISQIIITSLYIMISLFVSLGALWIVRSKLWQVKIFSR